MITKRSFIALLFSLFTLNGVFAQHVSEAEALEKAQAFLNSKTTKAGSGRKNAPVKARKLQRTAQSTGTDAYYVFNAEDNGGFVIVSGDERTDEILGYSTEGNIDVERMPVNMKAWLRGYEEQIGALSTDGATALTAKKISGKSIEPLIKTKWAQEWPYNKECPVIDGERCPTGCIATVNGDGKIDVADVTAIINLILGK